MKRAICLLFISLSFTVFMKSAIAESYLDHLKERFLFTQWSNSNGFPTNNALDVYQDSKGYIWVATYDGIIRYNGNEFRLFNKYSEEGFDATSANVLFEDSMDRLWIGTNENGIAYHKDGEFHYFNSTNGFTASSVLDIKEDSTGNIWIASMSGLTKMTTNGDRFEFENVIKGGHSFNHLLILDNNEILLTSIDGELIKFIQGEQIKYFPESSPYSKYKYQALLRDLSGNLWLGTTSGKVIKKSNNGHFTLFDNNVFSINKIIEIPKLNNETYIVFCSDSGIGVLNENNHSFKIYTEDSGLINNSIENIFIDVENNIWLTSKRAGLQKITVGKFKNYTKSDGLQNSIVNAVEEDDKGSFWIGTNAGLSILTSKNRFINNPITDYFKGVRIRHILQDKHQSIWLSAYGDKSLVRIKDNNITNINEEHGFVSKTVRVTYEDTKGWLWVGTTSGLYLIKEPQALDIKVIDVFSMLQLPSQYIMSITEDADGNIILGSNGKGIFYIDKDFNIQNFDTQRGLSGNVVFKVFSDSSKNLWVATNSGISLFQGESTSLL